MSSIPPYLDGYEKLQPSRLSNQLEALRDDIDIADLNFVVSGLNVGDLKKTVTKVRDSITAATISRTITGASTLTLTLEDIDLALTRSGLLGQKTTLIPDSGSATSASASFTRNVDCEIDGLWFRLVNYSKATVGRTLTLIFEDREVAVLRSYPRLGLRPNDPNPNAYKVFVGMSRIEVIVSLIAEAREYGATGPRMVSPMLRQLKAANASIAPQPLDPGKRQTTHQPGFPPQNGATSPVTVKDEKASPAQLQVLSDALDAAWQMLIRDPFLLEIGVMVLTQESGAGKASSNVFQQETNEDWPGGDTTTEAHAFFDHLLAARAAHPTYSQGLLASTVQRPLASINGTDPTGKAYEQWAQEAGHTVGLWLGTNEDIPVPQGLPGAAGSSTQLVPAGAVVGTASFTRGSQSNQGGRVVVVREDNWQCIQRLCQEVGWLAYCVSGTIYIEDWPSIARQAVRFEASEDDDGIDGIGAMIDTGMATVSATVQCRASRWGAPPGTVARIRDMGPVSGRWIVQTIARSLFSTATTITLQKPQESLQDAESSSPIQGVVPLLAQSGTNTAADTITADASGVRAAIVQAAQAAFARGWPDIQYSEVEPTRWTETSLARATPPTIFADCSSFVTLCYKAADAPDPNGVGYVRLGDTASLIAHGIKTENPQPGDLLFYGSLPKPNHVQLWIGDDTVIQMGVFGKGVQRETVKLVDFLRGVLSDGSAGAALGFYTYNLGPLG